MADNFGAIIQTTNLEYFAVTLPWNLDVPSSFTKVSINKKWSGTSVTY
jgi:hypothetical protein